MAVVFLLSVSLRFWGLGRFNTLVFDEVYFAKFANDYLTHTPFFDTHPPLSKYLIAIGIWLGSHFSIGKDTVNSLTGSPVSTFSYRCMNALTGSFIPLVVGAIAYQLSHRRSYAFVASLLISVDGLFLVESRYALTNIYLVLFGLLGQLFFLRALDNSTKRRGLWLVLSGVCFGASASIKWNGLWFLFGAYLMWICAWLIRLLQSLRPVAIDSSTTQPLSASNLSNPTEAQTPLQNLTQLNFLHLIFNLGIIPAVVYSLVWIPHLQLNPTPGFWDMQKQILSYHQHIGSGTKEHPYCSPWYSWPWMIRPVGYFFEKIGNTLNPSSALSPAMSAPTGKELYYDVHGMGNPVLCWLSTLAIILMLSMLILRIQAWLMTSETMTNSNVSFVRPVDWWIAVYLIVNYAANLLPWLRVTRCTFLYHYMGSSIFAFLAIAWIVEQCLRSYQIWLRAMGVTIIFVIFLAFLFWLPVYLGLPLPPEEFYLRMLFRSWI